MQNRTPIPRHERKLDLAFDLVPRKYRHDGWTPERQKAFIEALADTGCVSRAARQVNMSPESAYYLRRQPGAESFRRAWEAALDFGVQRLKDIAFERAIEGQLVPVFVAGKLMGFRRKRNDRLLMFCLRHYGQDATGRRVTVNYFSTRATAGAGAQSSPAFAGEGDHVKHGGGAAAALAAAESSTTTVKTIISGTAAGTLSKLERDDQLAATLNAFEGVDLDEEAQAEILRALESHAERRRLADPDRQDHAGERFAVQAADPGRDFIRLKPGDIEYAGDLESGVELEEFVPFNEGEPPWAIRYVSTRSAARNRRLSPADRRRIRLTRPLGDHGLAFGAQRIDQPARASAYPTSRRRSAKPMPPKPASIIAQVAGSGTGAAASS